MQHEDDANNLGKYQDDMIGLACKRHAEEDTEDVEWKERDDGHLDSLLDDGTELCKPLLQRRRVGIRNADAYYEGTHQRRHHIENGRNIQLEVGLQRISFLNCY